MPAFARGVTSTDRLDVTTTILAPFHGEHDHDRCLDEALRKAEISCRSQGLRLTSVRKQVLKLVWFGVADGFAFIYKNQTFFIKCYIFKA